MVRNLDSTGTDSLSVCWSVMNLGFLFDKRDFVSVQVLKKIPEAKTCVVLQRAVSDPTAPEASPDYIRSHVWTSSYVVRPSSRQDHVLVDHIYAADLNGVLAQLLCSNIVSRRLNGLKSFVDKFPTEASRANMVGVIATFNEMQDPEPAPGEADDEACVQQDKQYTEWSHSLRGRSGIRSRQRDKRELADMLMDQDY